MSGFLTLQLFNGKVEQSRIRPNQSARFIQADHRDRSDSMAIRLNVTWGKLLLCIWLIAWGVLELVPALAFRGAQNVMAVLAIITAILLLLDV